MKWLLVADQSVRLPDKLARQVRWVVQSR